MSSWLSKHTGKIPPSRRPVVGGHSKKWGVLLQQRQHVPKVPERTETATDMATFGITIDGIKLERDTAESFRNEGVWCYEAITPGLARRQSAGARFEWLGTDCNNAYVQSTGAYHYRGPLSANIVETSTTLGISVGRWR